MGSLEFQSGVHPFMAARLSTYLDLLYQDLIRGRQLERRKPGQPRRLPLVLPIVQIIGQQGLSLKAPQSSAVKRS